MTSPTHTAPARATSPIRLVLVDDHRMFRSGVKAELDPAHAFTPADHAGLSLQHAAEAKLREPALGKLRCQAAKHHVGDLRYGDFQSDPLQDTIGPGAPLASFNRSTEAYGLNACAL